MIANDAIPAVAYNRGGKAVCSLSNIPADALDAWVLGRLREVLLGDEAGVKAAVDAFVAAVRSPRGAEPKRDAGREVAALDKRIKATVAMLADPAFDGLDELKATLADLKRRRDALRAEAAPETPAAVAPLDEASLRRWARDRFAAIDRAVEYGPADPTGSLRRLVKAYIDRIEIDPATKSGVLYLPPDAMSCLAREAAINGAAHGERSEGARFWIPTLDEWLKASNYDPNRFGDGKAGYWLFPTTSDIEPVSGRPEDGGETSRGLVGSQFLEAGLYPDVESPWGLLDVSGTRPEWLSADETLNDNVLLNSQGPFLGGGTSRDDIGLNVGRASASQTRLTFRVATIPSPSISVVVTTCACLATARRRRRP